MFLNTIEIKYRWHYLLLMLTTAIFMYLNHSNINSSLLIATVLFLSYRMVNKRYFAIEKPWRYYLFLATLLAIYLKATSQTLAGKELMIMYLLSCYCFVCACILFLRDPRKYPSTNLIIFNFMNLTLSSTMSIKKPIIYAAQIFILSTITVMIALHTHEKQFKKFLYHRVFWYAFSIGSIFVTLKIIEVYSPKIDSYLNYLSNYNLSSLRNTMTIDSMESTWNNPNMQNNVILRVFAKEAPTYLKTSTFNYFKDNEWSNKDIDLSDQKLNTIEYENGLFTQIASSNRPDFSKPDCKIVLSLAMSGQLYYTNETTWLKTKTPLLKMDKAGIIATNTGRSGYELFFSEKKNIIEEPPPYYTLTQTILSPEDLHYLQNITSSILNENDTKETKVNKIHQYLKENHQYDIKPKIHAKGNAIIYFLKNNSNAHCQYFSSAAAFLLRTAGVPCRIATGYLCFRYNKIGNYWVSKAIDAHAWVEYYDNGWKTFDPTYNIRITNETQKFLKSFNGAYDYISYSFELLSYQMLSGEMRKYLETLWDKTIDILLENLILFYTITVLLFSYLIYLKLFNKKNKQINLFLKYEPIPKNKLKIVRDYEDIIRTLKQKNVPVSYQDTINDILSKIQTSSFSEQKKKQFTHTVYTYQQTRFKP